MTLAHLLTFFKSVIAHAFPPYAKRKHQLENNIGVLTRSSGVTGGLSIKRGDVSN